MSFRGDEIHVVTIVDKTHILERCRTVLPVCTFFLLNLSALNKCSKLNIAEYITPLVAEGYTRAAGQLFPSPLLPPATGTQFCPKWGPNGDPILSQMGT